MDRKGESKRCRALGQLDDVTLGREAEHLVGVHLQLHGFEKLIVIRRRLEMLRQPGDPARGIDGKGVFRPLAVAVGPVRRDTGFGDFVHLMGTNLHFDALAVAAQNGGVQAAIAVLLGLADIVLAARGQRPPASGFSPR